MLYLFTRSQATLKFMKQHKLCLQGQDFYYNAEWKNTTLLIIYIKQMYRSKRIKGLTNKMSRRLI